MKELAIMNRINLNQESKQTHSSNGFISTRIISRKKEEKKFDKETEEKDLKVMEKDQYGSEMKQMDSSV